ncbi:MAG: M61 family metallopeptidase [Neisseriaceae bacterium]|nr:M61 family metallopeptidase [Neisseriaceae bacterium]
MIDYGVRFLSTEAHLYEVVMVVPVKVAGPLTVRMPAWVPGSYMIRDFSRHIVNIVAEQAGQPLALTSLDKHTWQMTAPAAEAVTVTYQVYAFDVSVRGAFLDQQRGFFDGSALFLSWVGEEALPCRLRIEVPESLRDQGWQIATAMPAVDGKEGLFEARDYGHLIDCPVEMGVLTRLPFLAEGIEHEIVLSGAHQGDLARLVSDVEKICASQIRFFKGRTPFERYVFLLHVGHAIYGGLEHTDSTALLADRLCLPSRADKGLSDDYVLLLGLFSHEYFHAWNVKSIKPAAFDPYDLTQEVYTEQLWAFEGVTSYYDDLFLLRAGVITETDYLGLVAKNMTRVQRGAGRTKQTLAESSFSAWHKYYKQNENSPNAIVSYYQKGALMAMGLDLLIRLRSQHQHSLDDVMRALYADFEARGRGVTEAEWQAMAMAVTGLDLSDYFERALYSTDDLPLSELLAQHAVSLTWHAMPEQEPGGYVSQLPVSQAAVFFGAKFQQNNEGVTLTQVHDGGSAQSAGLSVHDRIIAINGFQTTDFVRQWANLRVGDEAIVHFFRAGVLLHAKVVALAAAKHTAYLQMVAQDCGRWLRERV